jgi:hypothetical protein
LIGRQFRNAGKRTVRSGTSAVDVCETGLTIKVRHCPPGTSKWNKIEHRLFCRITQN